MGRILINERGLTQAGYFRIGTLILDIPPEQIQCHKVINSNEVLPLRFPFAMPVKTGQARWDVTWSWKAIKDSSQVDPYNAWRDIQTLLAMFKASPFVEVENEHLRQLLNPGILSQGATNDDVMAFALRQMRVDTVPDLEDTLQVTMTMSWFNYRPYSKNFLYDDGTGNPVPNALSSAIYQNYLNKWIQNNLLNDPTQQPSTGPAVSDIDWNSQTPGTITFSCREYQAVGLPATLIAPTTGSSSTTTPAGTPGTTTLANPGATQPGTAAQSTQSGFVDNIVVTLSGASDPQVQWWVAAVQSAEGAGYQVKNSYPDPITHKTSSAYGILQWTMAGAIDAMLESDGLKTPGLSLGTSYIATAQQAGYLLKSSSSRSGYTWSKALPTGTPLSTDPQTATYWGWMSNPPSAVSGGSTQLQNNMATAWAYSLITQFNGDILQSWEAHLFGPGKVSSAQNQLSLYNTWFTKTASSWRTSSGNPQAFAPFQNTPAAGAAPGAAISNPVTSGTNSSQASSSNSAIAPGTLPLTDYIRYLLNDGWVYDYATESAAFLYKEHNLKLTDRMHGDIPSSTDIPDINAEYFAFTNQISVVFVNNIAQLPLAGYQYPTYQHLGPVSTLVSVGLLSNAAISPSTDLYPEPKHPALELLSDLTNMLENQFQVLRNEWRRVNSIQRMQAVSVKSQVLNLLGIRGLLTKEFTTETIPESPSLVSAQYNAVQYENVFEEVDIAPYLISSTPSQLQTQWLTILRNGTLNPFQGDQSLLTLTNLSTLMQQANNSPSSVTPGSAPASLLFTWLTSSSPAAPNAAYIVPTPYSFTGAQQQLMLKVLDEQSTGASGIPGLVGPGGIPGAPVGGSTGGGASFSGQYSDIAAAIKTHSQLNYSDYFLIRNGINPTIQDYNNFQTMATQIDASIAAALAANPSQESPLNQLFDLYLGYATSNNVLNINGQMVRAMDTPQIQPLFVNAATTTTPASQPQNLEGHSCYQDLGIKELTLGGRDYTPSVYFYDDNKDLTTILQGQVSQAVTATAASTLEFANRTPYADKTNLITTSTASFTGNLQGILSSIKPSSYTMAKAFPTFKLFLMEDNSQKPFYAYDKFHSYASVLDMEIIRYRDRPDTAVIQISDLMHLLDQHLYDDTPQGRQEQLLRSPTETVVPGNEALTGQSGAAIPIQETEAWVLDNRFPQITQHYGGTDPKFPLKYFALQTGTKIQVRMGFSNNPDLLVPVFTGQVTEIEGDEILRITAQSYMLELTVPAPDDIRRDGFSVDGFVNQITNALATSIRDVGTNIPHIPSDLFSVFGNSPAYGGWGTVGGITIPGIITPGGSVIDVMSSMLKVSTAKHFGSWQLGAPTDPYIKGYTWQSLSASALNLLSTSPLTQGATGLEAGYNRSFENILTSHIFGSDGSAVADASGGLRTWWYEKPGGYGAPQYFVPKDPTIVPWTLIQDIARRYPEFILAVKQYGFPFTADATLVFANPHDFYSTRPPMPNEVETQQQAATTSPQSFNLWWTTGANSGRAQFIAYCIGLGSQWGALVLKNYDQSIGYTGDSSSLIIGNQSVGQLNIISGTPTTVANQLAAHIDGGGAPVFFTITQLFTQSTASPLSSLLDIGSTSVPRAISVNQAQQGLTQLIQNYYTYLNQAVSGGSSTVTNDRMKPVRQWHLVNGDTIIHNGIMLNDKFYNTVRLNNQTLPANDAIPSQYRRTLVADQFIVSPKNFDGHIPITNAYLQSFLRDELTKAYRGELVLLGNPAIEPFDVLMLLDPSTGIAGPVEVDTVIHSFNAENGYITIVRPRALVVVNDKLSMPVNQAVWSMLSDIQGIVGGLPSVQPFMPTSGTEVLADTALAVGVGLAAAPWIAGAAVLGGSSLMFWAGKVVNRLNPMGMIPLTRYTRPWISGLEGWKIDDVFGTAATKWQYFKVDEIEPLVFSYRVARGMQLI